MKNRVLIFAFAVFAFGMFANKSFGQGLVKGSAPKPLVCPNDALSPIAGKPYDYSATFTPAAGTAFWYATKSTSIVTGGVRTAAVEAAGGDVVTVGTNYAADQANAPSPSTTNITWNSKGLSTVTPAAPLFVVVEYKAPASSCSNNMKVYNIIPKNGFTVDIRSMQSDMSASVDYGAKTEQCVADVKAATYNLVTKVMDMDYGTQTLYFEVIAANFTGSFTPSFQITGLAAGQTAEIFWGATAATATTSIGAIVNSTPVTAAAVTTALTNTSEGVSMYVKVVVQNNKYEGLALQTIDLAVDAVNAEGLKDVKEADCTENGPFADVASQDIKPRPGVAPVAPATFIAEF